MRLVSICRSGIAITITLTIAACYSSDPIPADKAEFIGLWIAEDRYVSVFANGRLEYKRKRGFGLHDRSTGHVTFEANRLKASPFMSFVIASAPHQVDGQWQMTLPQRNNLSAIMSI